MKRVIASALFSCNDPFHIYDVSVNVLSPKQLKENHILLLHGGADISPSIYKQEPISYCHAGHKPSDRDMMEMALVEQAVKMQLPIIGICRGAQLLCAMDGGYLIQHIDGHTGGKHDIRDTMTNDVYKANSCHHQMLVPNPEHNNVVLAECLQPTTGIDKNEKSIIVKTIPEIVYFPQMNAIGIQGHPEWAPNTPYTAYCSLLIQRYIIKEF